MALSSAIFIALQLTSVWAFDDFSYSQQDQWPSICVTGNTMRQSPIDVITNNVQFDENLIDMEMTGWDIEYNGTFSNEGRNVRFTPDNSQATTRNHLGTYDFLQFHFHWGNRTGEGSEHRVDSDPGELEIHFVQRKQNEDDATVGDYLAVISVIADVVEGDSDLEGPWLQLDASRIPVYMDNISVVGFCVDRLLPTNRDYYFYEGSFTSPPCSEVVGWFVMRERITVPAAYLRQLRNVQWSSGELIGFNFRMPQDLGGRVVTTNHAVILRPILALFASMHVVLFILLLV